MREKERKEERGARRGKQERERREGFGLGRRPRGGDREEDRGLTVPQETSRGLTCSIEAGLRVNLNAHREFPAGEAGEGGRLGG